eukprot:6929038-Pyramimonas_sp.AAC.1
MLKPSDPPPPTTTTATQGRGEDIQRPTPSAGSPKRNRRDFARFNAVSSDFGGDFAGGIPSRVGLYRECTWRACAPVGRARGRSGPLCGARLPPRPARCPLAPAPRTTPAPAARRTPATVGNTSQPQRPPQRPPQSQPRRPPQSVRPRAAGLVWSESVAARRKAQAAVGWRHLATHLSTLQGPGNSLSSRRRAARECSLTSAHLDVGAVRLGLHDGVHIVHTRLLHQLRLHVRSRGHARQQRLQLALVHLRPRRPRAEHIPIRRPPVGRQSEVLYSNELVPRRS